MRSEKGTLSRRITQDKNIAGRLSDGVKYNQPAIYTGVAETFQQTHPHLIEQEINQLLQEHDTIEEMHQKYSEQIQVHRMQKDRLEGGLERNRKELEEDKKAVETLLQQLNDRLNTSQFQTLDEVMELL